MFLCTIKTIYLGVASTIAVTNNCLGVGSMDISPPSLRKLPLSVNLKASLLTIAGADLITEDLERK